MNHYTVLLLRPDYLADEFGKDTYLAWVSANGVAEAMKAAQLEATLADAECWSLEEIVEEGGSPDDYHVLFATMGHLRDMSLDNE